MKPGQKVEDLLKELERLAKAAKVRVSYEAIGGELGAGGLCRVKGEWRVIIDKRSPTAERVTVLAAGLGRLGPTVLADLQEALAAEGQALSAEAASVLQRSQRPISGGAARPPEPPKPEGAL